jgi:hypothetical protein
MAHTCSECGEVCYCGGDIDDIVMGYCVNHCSDLADHGDCDDDCERYGLDFRETHP